MSMTPSQVKTIVRNQCADDSENFWTDTEIYLYMTMAQREILLRHPELNDQRSRIAANAYQGRYTLTGVTPLNMEWVGWIEDPSTNGADAYDMDISYKLKRIDSLDMYATQGADSTVSGQPEYYRWDDYDNVLQIYPTPDTTGQFMLHYRVHDADVSSTGSFISGIEPYAHFIADYCLYRMFLKDQELITEAQTYGGLWRRHMEEIERSVESRMMHDRFVTVKDEDDNYYSTDLGMV